jgi:hypothetical protein
MQQHVSVPASNTSRACSSSSSNNNSFSSRCVWHTGAKTAAAPAASKCRTGLSTVLPVQVLTWLVLPFFQVYADAGDFTVGGRCMTSLKENGLLYGLAGAAGDWGGLVCHSRQQRS